MLRLFLLLPEVAVALAVARCNGVPWPDRCEDFESARARSERFLYENMPPWDVLNNGTYALGLVPASVDHALQVRKNFSWAAQVPEDVWMDYVVPYANVNEARSNWRPLLFDALSLSDDQKSLSEVAVLVNERVWSALRPEKPIYFKSSQTPLIFDTMSAIAFGFASCTGLSILYVDALRSVGVPARLVGTPAWHGKAADGNHNWVEIWLGPKAGLKGGDWTFIEGSPAGPGEKLLEPCDKWFCNPSHFDGHTETYAAKFKKGGLHYPMSWDLANHGIPGINQTDFYNEICGKC